MHVFRSDDPRDELAKGTRDELWDFSKSIGRLSDMLNYMSKFSWTPNKGFIRVDREASQANVTKEDMAHWLRNMGLVDFRAAVRIQGRPIEMEAPSRKEAPPVKKNVSDMTMGELRKELKARGIKFSPKDKKPDLQGKLSEQDAA